LERAAAGRYSRSSLKELPAGLRASGFDGDRVRADVRSRVTLLRHDVRDEPPARGFDVVLCRNLVFTYFEERLQLDVGRRLVSALADDGVLVVGGHETLPARLDALEPWLPSTYRRSGAR
jgi:chemotaxis protein methyltransferase CheR